MLHSGYNILSPTIDIIRVVIKEYAPECHRLVEKQDSNDNRADSTDTRPHGIDRTKRNRARGPSHEIHA